jgi:dolichol-phosphate mannosyltransferase
MLSLVFPTYNESENLPVLLRKVAEALKGVEHEVIIVDDNSPDRTWEIAREMSRSMPNLRVIRRIGRKGLSSAVIEGFLAAKGDVLAVADADLQHDLSILPKLAEAAGRTRGMAVGSRYAEGGSVGQWDERRHTMSRIATQMAIRLCQVRCADPMSGFFAIERSLLEKTLPLLNPKGFKILLDLLVHVPAGTSVTEVPYTFGLREHGESKLSRRVQVEFLEYIYDATVGRYIPLTLVKYCIVGAVGVAVNLIVYLLLSRLLGERAGDLLGYSPALLAGIEAAIIFNFLLNNSWTFATVKLRGWKAVFGFIRYNLACVFGALASYAVTSSLYAHGQHALASVAVGAGVGMIWNYTMSRLFTWKTDA